MVGGIVIFAHKARVKNFATTPTFGINHALLVLMSFLVVAMKKRRVS